LVDDGNGGGHCLVHLPSRNREIDAADRRRCLPERHLGRRCKARENDAEGDRYLEQLRATNVETDRGSRLPVGDHKGHARVDDFEVVVCRTDPAIGSPG
jgi:hypothetical protein